MSLRSQLGTVYRQVLCSLHRRTATLENSGPFVSFAFDDFPRTAYTAGGSILKKSGFRGTYYVAMGLMNTSNDLGEQFRLEDLRSVVAEGHEVATHTFSHSSSRKLSVSAFRTDALKGHRAIQETSLTPSANFAYPYGELTLGAKKALGKEMKSCRGTYGGLNGPLVDLNLLRANSLYGDLDRLEMAEQLIRENAKRNSWLIFYTHDVRSNPSRFGCTPELLESTVRLVEQHGARVLPVAEVLEHLTSNAGVS
jgi:peptidoglycan/xylan/chitin deacetylase (PgdA/CDA1 family)